MLKRRTRTLSTAAVAAVLAVGALSACGDGKDDAKSTALDQTTVSGGSASEAPKVEVKPKPLKVTETQTRVLKAGDGPVVKGDEIVSLKFVLLNGKDGSQLDTNFDKQTLGLNLGDAKLLPGIKKGVANQKVGSRLLVAMPPKDAFGDQGNANIKVAKDDTIVFLFDVVSATKPLKSAEGKAVNPPKNLPSVKVQEGKAATITIPKGKKPPTKTVGQLLVKGKGAKVEAGQTLTVQYVGQVYPTGAVFDESWSKQPTSFQIGGEGLIKCWNDLLVGQNVGSRVVIVCPADTAYGDKPPSGSKIGKGDTLIFAVDLLDAS